MSSSRWPHRFVSLLAVLAVALFALTLGSSDTDARSLGTVKVKTTAEQHNQHVTGEIIITNHGRTDAVVHNISDWLEVRFRGNVDPGLPQGTTPTWFKIADVPVANPGVIPAGSTVVIPYSADLCAAVFGVSGLTITGTRNVVEVEASEGSRDGTARAHAAFQLGDFICF
jgi:hypothetical protein